MNRWLAVMPLAALALVVLLMAGWALWRENRVVPDALIGQSVPALSLPDLDGAPQPDLAALVKGEVGVINVFASWCAPCRIEHEHLMALQAEGVRVIGVAWRDQPEDTRAFLDELGNPYAHVLSDPGGGAGVELGITGVPETYVVSADGRFVAKHGGPIADARDLDELRAVIARAR